MLNFLSFEPTDRPSWRKTGLPTTSQMLADIVVYTERYTNLPARAKEFVLGQYRKAAAVQFVLHANLSEETGLSDFDSTQQVLEDNISSFDSKKQRETRQLGAALQTLSEHYTETCTVDDLSTWEALVLTPDTIQQIHTTLMRGSLHVGGALRTASARGGTPDGSLYFYQEPDQIPSLLLSVCDFYNESLKQIPAGTASAIPQLYRLAAVLFVQFVTVHPFSDGNGRLARILASHVLRAVTPFPVTAYSGAASSRKVYLQAIMSARTGSDSEFLRLAAPCDFAALMIEAGWGAWHNCFENCERLGYLESSRMRGALCADTYSETAHASLADIGLSLEERQEEHEALEKAAADILGGTMRNLRVHLARGTSCVMFKA